MVDFALPRHVVEHATQIPHDALMQRFVELRQTKSALWRAVLGYHVYAPLFVSWFVQNSSDVVGKELLALATPLLESCSGMRSSSGHFRESEKELVTRSAELAEIFATEFDPDHKVLRKWIRELGLAKSGIGSVALARLLEEHKTRFRRSGRFCVHVDDLARLEAKYERQHERIVVANLRLVGAAVRKMTYRYTSPEDLGSEATIGLMTAVHRFDPTRGIKFSTYAIHWIRHAVMRTQQNEDLVRIPVHQQEKARKIQLTRERLRREEGAEPTDEHLLEVVNEGRTDPRRIKLYELTLLDRRATSLISLDKTYGEGEDGYTLLDWIPDQSTLVEEQHEQHELHEIRELVEEVLAGMSAAEADAFRFVSGIFDDDPRYASVKMTLAFFGEKHKLSRERIRQLSLSAIEKIREAIRRRKLVRSFHHVVGSGLSATRGPRLDLRDPSICLHDGLEVGRKKLRRLTKREHVVVPLEQRLDEPVDEICGREGSTGA